MRVAPGINPFVFLKSFQGEAKSVEEHKRQEKKDGSARHKVQSIMRDLYSAL